MTAVNFGRIAVLGAGKMGGTLVHSLRASGHPADLIVATGRRADLLERLHASEGVQTTTDNLEAVRGADLIFLCVKPQGLEALLQEIRSELTSDQLVVSIAAGVDTARIEEQLDSGVPVVRAMPNTPSRVGEGMTVVSRGRSASAEHLAAARAVFATMGRALELEEQHLDAVTGLSASGPAFVYIIIEALAEGGVKVGLPRTVATELASQACLGAAKMVLETGKAPAQLKDDVTTPAGCTMDGILELEAGGLRVTLIKAVVEATRRAGELVR